MAAILLSIALLILGWRVLRLERLLEDTMEKLATVSGKVKAHHDMIVEIAAQSKNDEAH